ncbi:MAG: 1,4-dihydroxy-2-naphthoate polyprenyltransferase [Actinomycetota bacterium]|jgi:1,4-dihydroxy-2-naphthoate octaprenyltransferase|nr:1,4-dihydroxy-2-naphthoate polyprenyltransferase [Actinomycetota bacterium]
MSEMRLLAAPGTGRRAAWLYALRTTNPPPGVTPDPITRWLVVTRAAVLPMTVFAGLVAGLLAVRAPGFSWPDYALALVGITVAHTANNLMNDLADTQAGTDTDSYPRALYAPHPILSGLVTKRQLVTAILLCQVFDLGVMLVLLTQRGWPVVAFAVGGLVLSYAYTAPPLRLKKIGLGEPDVFVTWGPLMVAGTYYSAVGDLPWQVWVASVPYGLLCTTVLMGKHIDKIPYDAAAGTRTLPVLLGEARARTLTKALLSAFYITTAEAVALGALPWPVLLVLVAAPVMRKAAQALSRPRPDEPPAGFPVWPLWFAAICFVHTRRAGLLLVIGLAVAAVFQVGLPLG